MIENLQETLHWGERKESKGAKICASIRWELECENAPKVSAKYLKVKNMQNQTNAKHSRSPEDIFKSA